MRWNRRTAVSATVHLLHSALILTLTLFVPGDAASYLRYIWCLAAFFSVLGLLLLLRVGNYDGTTDDQIGDLIRQSYWVATGLYLCLLAASLFLILRR